MLSGGGGGAKSDTVQEGSQVCLRSRPIYSSGCRGIYIKGSTLKCGILQESVFSLSEKCRFKIIDDVSSERIEAMEVDQRDLSQPGPSIGRCSLVAMTTYKVDFYRK